MVSYLLARPWLTLIYRAIFWWRGQDFSFIRELVRAPGSALDFELAVPSQVRVISVLGFPLSRHVRSRRSRRSHRRLSRYGPNDGATILSDCCCLPGLVLPVWGADHYLDSPYRPEQLLRAILQYLGETCDLFVRSPRSTTLSNSDASV
jgi:hypothetical protein